jgi:hypothetical protein
MSCCALAMLRCHACNATLRACNATLQALADAHVARLQCYVARLQCYVARLQCYVASACRCSRCKRLQCYVARLQCYVARLQCHACALADTTLRTCNATLRAMQRYVAREKTCKKKQKFSFFLPFHATNTQ